MSLDDAFDDQPDETPHYEGGTMNMHAVEKSAGRQGWGEVNSISEVAPGIVFADCVGHGGYRLSRERNNAIPRPLRKTWYEEDAESAIVGMYHPDAFEGDLLDPESRVRDYFPDEYEEATGRKLALGESYTRDEREYHRLNADKWHLTSALNRQSTGMVDVTYKRGDERVRAEVPSEAFVAMREEAQAHGTYHPHSVALNDAQLEGFNPVAEPEPEWGPTPRYRGVDTAGLTPAQKDRANKDLDRPMRFKGSDAVTSLRNEAAQGRIEGKRARFDEASGKMIYSVTRSTTPEGVAARDSSVFSVQVSKAGWDAFEAPDSRSESDRIAAQINQANHREKTSARRGDQEAAQAARSRSRKLHAELRARRDRT